MHNTARKFRNAEARFGTGKPHVHVYRELVAATDCQAVDFRNEDCRQRREKAQDSAEEAEKVAWVDAFDGVLSANDMQVQMRDPNLRVCT